MIRVGQEPQAFAPRLDQLDAANVIPRVWAGDYTVWETGPTEITNRLGWLRAPETMREHLVSLRKFATAVRGERCDAIALLGMGGSSLAPETLATMSRVADGPRLVVLDTTHPGAVRRAIDALDPARTFYIVSTKSGTTPETLALFRTFHRRAADALGKDGAGARFAAITDPGSPLVRLAHDVGFRRVFLNDPTIGGRYSALSLVGLVPAALLGLDLEELLDSARAIAGRCGPSVPVDRNPAALLAALLAAHIDGGRDKATFVIPKPLASFGDWVEQLIAESTGKRGTGVVPVVGEPIGEAAVYGMDRVFVRLGSDTESPEPSIAVDFPGVESLGAQFFLWEFATALLGHLLKVNPFDQPDVESSKEATRRILAAYRDRGLRPERECIRLTPEALTEFATQAMPGDYIALLAYLDPRSETRRRLQALRCALRDKTHCATTLGFGPRYLHSTGQLHKGDCGRGMFLLLVDDPEGDVAIPDETSRSIGLRLLVHAQAFGDARSLSDRGRRLVVADLGRDVAASLANATLGRPPEEGTT